MPSYQLVGLPFPLRRDAAPRTQRIGRNSHNSEFSAQPPVGIINNYEHVCSFGRSHCAISAYGDVYPCIQLPVSAGNIMREPFSRIWHNSEWLKEVRAYSPDKVTDCRGCGDRAYCRRCPGLAYVEDGSLYAKSTEACRHARSLSRL